MGTVHRFVEPGGYEVIAETADTRFVQDNLNNGYDYFYLVSAVSVEGDETWLTNPPVLNSSELPASAHVGEEFTITADIYDELSGVYWGGTRNGVGGQPGPDRVGSCGRVRPDPRWNLQLFAGDRSLDREGGLPRELPPGQGASSSSAARRLGG